MSCRAVIDQFGERLDGRLDEPRQAAFDAHLAGCADCRREWAAYAGAWQALDRDEGIEPSFGFAERTLRRLNEPQEAVRWWVWRPSLRWVALAATVTSWRASWQSSTEEKTLVRISSWRSDQESAMPRAWRPKVPSNRTRRPAGDSDAPRPANK